MKSTGPKTKRGKQRTKQNALQHGLTAETVVTVFENADDYRAFEALLLADHLPRTSIGQQLVARLASLLWRLRRATLIETGLFNIQGHNLVAHRHSHELMDDGMAAFYRILRDPYRRREQFGITQPTDVNASSKGGMTDPPAQLQTGTDAALTYMRMCNLNPGVLKRLGRYEVALWRQVTQTFMALELAERHSVPTIPRELGNAGTTTAGAQS